MSVLTIRTNVSQATNVLIKDIGLIIPSGGAVQTFTRRFELKQLIQSKDLVTLATDQAFGANSSTLIIGNGNADLPVNSGNPIDQLSFLAGGLSFLSVTATNTITTTSSTDVLMTNMSITVPVIGTYQAFFSATVGNSGAGNSTFCTFYFDTSQDFQGERQLASIQNNYRGIISMVSGGIMPAGGSVQVRWRRSNGTATAEQRSLFVVWAGSYGSDLGADNT